MSLGYWTAHLRREKKKKVGERLQQGLARHRIWKLGKRAVDLYQVLNLCHDMAQTIRAIW